jgi:hypothetical protein
MNYLSDETAVLLMSLVVTFLIVCSILILARKEAREAIESVTTTPRSSGPRIERKAS